MFLKKIYRTICSTVQNLLFQDSIASVNESLVKSEEIENDDVPASEYKSHCDASLDNTGAESDGIGMNTTFNIPDKDGNSK